MKARANYEAKSQAAKQARNRHHDDGQAVFFDPCADPRHVARFIK